jgi:uncharacterized protein YxjI
MTKEEKIEKILISLKEATECGATEWNLRDSIFNSEANYGFRAYSIDKETHFDLDISLNNDLTGIAGHGYIWIYNKGLSDGKKQIVPNSITREIEKYIYENKIKPNLIIKAEDDALDSILNDIRGKSRMRDDKLTEILGESEQETDAIHSPENIVEKISKKWYRIFSPE